MTRITSFLLLKFKFIKRFKLIIQITLLFECFDEDFLLLDLLFDAADDDDVVAVVVVEFLPLLDLDLLDSESIFFFYYYYRRIF
jgi:hypothetical protein